MDISTDIKEIIAKSFKKPLEEISGNTIFLKELEADSLKMLELVSDIEAHYNIKIDNEDLYNLKSIDQLIILVKKHLAKNQ